jgi:hypothetical protein
MGTIKRRHTWIYIRIYLRKAIVSDVNCSKNSNCWGLTVLRIAIDSSKKSNCFYFPARKSHPCVLLMPSITIPDRWTGSPKMKELFTGDLR